MSVRPEHVTRLLHALSDDAAASQQPRPADELFALAYDQLRSIARQRLKDQRVGHTLGATELVHEAWLRLVGDRPIVANDRRHFFAAAAEAMRCILIDYARGRGRIKRGGGVRPVINGVLDLATEEKIADAVALDELIHRLEQEDGQVAAVVRLRFYAGLSIEETADALGISPRTVKRNWAYARSWLLDAWQAGEAHDPGS